MIFGCVLSNTHGCCRLLSDQQWFVGFKLEPSRLVTQLDSSNGSYMSFLIFTYREPNARWSEKQYGKHINYYFLLSIKLMIIFFPLLFLVIKLMSSCNKVHGYISKSACNPHFRPLLTWRFSCCNILQKKLVTRFIRLF